MVFIAPVLLITIAYIIGSLPMKLLTRGDCGPGERSLIGTLFMLLLWECIMLPGIKMLASFDLLCRFYAGILLILVMISIIVCRKDLVKDIVFKNLQLLVPAIILIVLFAVQCAYVLNVYPDIAMDYTAETVNTTLESDLIYENNPYMGDTFVHGITFRGKVVTLPLFYAFLARATGLKATVTVFRMVPIWVLLLSMIAFGLLGKVMFPSKEKQPLYFVIGMGILNLFGVFSRNCSFFYSMRKGFAGETFLTAVLLPIQLYAMVKLGAGKDKSKFILLGILLLTSLVVVDITKGLMMLGLSMVAGFAIIGAYHIRRRIGAKRS